jgi:hypothetical protein
VNIILVNLIPKNKKRKLGLLEVEGKKNRVEKFLETLETEENRECLVGIQTLCPKFVLSFGIVPCKHLTLNITKIIGWGSVLGFKQKAIVPSGR